MVRIEDESGAWFSLEHGGFWMDEMIVLEAQAETNWFKGTVSTAFFPNELEAFVVGLKKLHEDCAGAYRFESTDEKAIELTFAMGKRGDLAITLRLQNRPDFLNELRVTVNVDQSYLPGIIAQTYTLLEPS